MLLHPYVTNISLHNIQRLCLLPATALIHTNIHSGRSTGHDKVCFSNHSLINKSKNIINSVNQVWYADDAFKAGKVNWLYECWDLINMEGPK